MPRAAIYARFSDDKQNERSVDDQIALCRELAARESLDVFATFEDRAISGASIANRPGFQSMMRAAEARLFDVLVAEDMDRIFRDQADYHATRKRLDFLGITIHTASGKVTRIDGALRALMGEMYLENLALHVRRGLEGVLRSGRHPGGKAYGYRAVPGRAGELEIVEREATIVREIFARYADGATSREIAIDFNRRGIKAPRGGVWNASTINGNATRSGGILHNEIYLGRIVWNKTRFIKDPATGKRVSRPNPRTQHKAIDAPALRLIDDATWTKTRARDHAPHDKRPPRPVRMLSGLLRCGTCGSGMASAGAKGTGARVQCSAHRESGTCRNGRKVPRARVEQLVLDGLQSEFENPAYLIAFVEEYNAERRRLAKQASRSKARVEQRLGEVGREIERLVDAIAKGTAGDHVTPRINELTIERKRLQSEAAVDRPQDVAIHPGAVRAYLRDIAVLREADRDDVLSVDQIETLRRTIDHVVVFAPPGTDKVEVEVVTMLDALLKPADSKGSSRGVLGGSERPIPAGTPRLAETLLYRFRRAS